jgi:hypothetical protein
MFFAAQIRQRERTRLIGLGREEVFEKAGNHDRPAVHARTWTDIDDIVRSIRVERERLDKDVEN